MASSHVDPIANAAQFGPTTRLASERQHGAGLLPDRDTLFNEGTLRAPANGLLPDRRRRARLTGRILFNKGKLPRWQAFASP